MKTKKWLGLATALSPYDAPAGTTQEQNNLQVLLPGQAKPRDGMEYVCGEANYVAYSVYAKPNGLNVADTLLVHAAEGNALNPSRGLYEVQTNGTYTLKSALTDSLSNYRPTFAEDRHGRVYVFYGNSVAPRLYRKKIASGSTVTEVVNVGLPAPTSAPSLTLDGTGVFVERVDILNSGGAYADTPTISFSMGAGGSFFREAKARAVLEAGRVVNIEVTDGGSNYTEHPAVVIGGTIGSGFTGKAFVTTSPDVYSISNFQNYSVVAGVVTENNPPLAYSPALTDFNNQTPAPTLGGSETYGSISFSPVSQQITIAVPQSTLAIASSASGQIVFAGDKTAYEDYRISYAGGPANLYASSITYDAGTKASTVLLGNGGSLTVPPLTDVTFWSTQDVSLLSQPAQLTFTATVPLTPAGSGSGATALITFADNSVQYSTPLPLGTDNNTINQYTKTYMDTTAYNGTCFGLQGHPYRMIRGWAGRATRAENLGGSDTGTPITAYWSDYSHIGYFVNTGTASVPVWTQKFAALQLGSVTVGGATLNYAYADIELVPTGDIAQSSNASHPTYRVKFGYCVTSGTYSWYRNWYEDTRVFNDSQCGPNEYQFPSAYTGRCGAWWGYEQCTKFISAKNVTWWRHAIPQPVVDFWKDDESATYTSHYGFDINSTIAKISNGSNIAQNTNYQLRFYQQDASRQVSTSDQGSSGATYRDFGYGSNAPYYGNNFATITFNATETVVSAGAVPPGGIVGTPTINNQGTGWASIDSASVQLLKRPLGGSTIDSLSFGPKYKWQALLEQQAASTDFITSASVTSTGSNYLTPPTILTRTTQGYGLVIEPEIVDGKVTKLSVVDGGGGFSANDQPLLYTSDQRAQAIAVMRPAMQGVYRCAYRYADTSATVVGTASITTVAGSTSATMTYSGSLTLTGLVLRGATVPFMTKVQSADALGAEFNITLTRPATSTATSAAVELRDYTKPIAYSNFSPIVDVDCGPNAQRTRTSRINWTIAGGAPPRADTVELYRTSGDQSLVFYRLEIYGEVYGNNIVLVGEDTLNDEELFDSSRPHYAAVPIVLPNGALNAYRFGVPRSDMASACAFQDRLWYAAATGGTEVNTLFFSEFDEFESCPPENSLSIQNNHRANDSITALVPFGSVLLIMQRTHCHQLTYNTDPNIDAAIQLVANRGLANPQCYDIYNNVLYGLDEKGVYALNRSGEVEPISEPIADMFVDNKIDFTKQQSFFVKVDPQKRLLRAFVCDETARDIGNYASLILCYHLDYKVWWTESYSNGLLSATETSLDATDRLTPVYSSLDGKVYQFKGVVDQPYRCLNGDVTVTSNATFDEPPTLVAYTRVETEQGSGVFENYGFGSGARFLPVMKGGKISEIVILDRGFGYGVADQSGGGVVNNQDPYQAGVYTLDGTLVGTVSALDPSNTTAKVAVPWYVKTHNYELINDENARGGDGLMDRSVLLTYAPTRTNATIALRQFFNNSIAPRENVMPRNRGTGFVHETEGAQATLNMKSLRSPLASATGVSKAVFAGRATGDMAGTDRHIAVGIYSPPSVVTDISTVSPAIIYGIEMRGVLDGQ